MRPARDVDDFKARGPPPPPSRYETRPGYYAEPEVAPPGYPRYPPPPPRDFYDRYERRPQHSDRFAPYPPSSARPRSPPLRAREEFDRPPRYVVTLISIAVCLTYLPYSEYPGPPSDYPRMAADYPRSGSSDRYRLVTLNHAASQADKLCRRRSQSPRVASNAGYDSGYAPSAGAPPYKGPSGFPSNGYSSGGPPRGVLSARDYLPRPRDEDPGFRRL